MKQMKHWQDPVNALVGVWLILSPWALGFQGETNALANAVIVGVLLIAAALGAIFVPRAWEEWTEGALGLWLAISPWALGFAGLQNAMISTVASGIVVMVLALWVLMTDKDYAGWLGDTTATPR
ncbi:MAG: SPW repeat protein [Ramlibacter sp.]|nr:SPW repeat protein [Ramlibacter sp.]